MSAQNAHWKRPVLVFSTTAVGLACFVSALLVSLDLKVTDSLGSALILVAMWIPAVARFITVRTVDRDWKAPLPLRRWGRPRWAIIGLPLFASAAIYTVAYGASSLFGMSRAAPVWDSPGSIAANLAFNLPVLAVIGLFGGLGEELGWRGYLQPRLDQAGVRGAMLWVIVIEWIFHLPVIFFVGYLESTSMAASLGLFFLLKLGATPLWTFGTYQLRSIWVAAWFHSLHNGLSQVLFPKALGAGDPLWLEESGLLPSMTYVVVAALIVGWVWRTRGGWVHFAQKQLTSPPSE